MIKEKTFEEVKEDFFNVKRSYGQLHDLMKIFVYLYTNSIDDEFYMDNNEYIAKNCMYTMATIIEKSLEITLKNIEQLYFDFEFLDKR